MISLLHKFHGNLRTGVKTKRNEQQFIILKKVAKTFRRRLLERNKNRTLNLRDGGSSAQCVSAGVLNDGELIGVGLPDVLGVVVVFGRHNDFVGDEERRVETHTELANKLRGGLVLSLHV